MSSWIEVLQSLVNRASAEAAEALAHNRPVQVGQWGEITKSFKKIQSQIEAMSSTKNTAAPPGA